MSTIEHGVDSQVGGYSTIPEDLRVGAGGVNVNLLNLHLDLSLSPAPSIHVPMYLDAAVYFIDSIPAILL